MQRHRFYALKSQISISAITLDGDESHHLSRALRLTKGDHVFVFDGEGNEWECEIVAVGKREANLNILRPLTEEVESPLRLTLAQALIKGDKFDWVVQKATELGVTRIVPLLTDHSEIRLNKPRAEDKAEGRLQRWRRVSLEAVKQSGRRRLVEITEPTTFPDFCQSNAAHHNLIFSERGGRPLREVAIELYRVNQLGLCVGSEGGWSEAELQTAAAHNFIPIHLGARILRTETAATAAVTLAQHLFGDLR
jgi:16S rRNA (uracil1498-N3)-methyltransferase